MRRKKIAVFCGAVGMISLLLAGCGDGTVSEEEIVVPREEENTQGEEEPEGEGAQGSSGEKETGSNGIAGQVQAPERYVWETSSDFISVAVDAPVVLPETEGFKTYKVTGRVFTQEDYDQVNQTLLKGGELWMRDYDAMAGSNGFTLSEIDKLVERLQIQKEGTWTDKKIYAEKLAECEALRMEAPEEPVIVKVPALVPYNENNDEGNVNVEDEDNWLSGYVTMDGEDYWVSLDNNLRDDWRWISFTILSPRTLGSYSFFMDEDMENLNPGISTENVRQEAQKLAADMGFTDLAVSGEEYLHAEVFDERLGKVVEEKTGYAIHFTRTLEGIPVTYTHNEGSSVENGVSSSWPYEKLDFIFDEKGMDCFRWTNPYNIEEISDEYVFLIPFSEIQNVFEEMLMKKCHDRYADSDMRLTFQVDEVRLGYMRIMEKGNTKEGTMVPVWDFLGSSTMIYGDTDEGYTEGGPYNCLLTINAMDGTVIDRDLGY